MLGGGDGEAGGGAAAIMAGIGQDGGASGGGGEVFEGDRSTGGNRWPRQETISLLKIRSDMDVVFRDSSLKAPLWEEVSRKMAELGYHRSAKKCKEKFENVYKYHKRTKEGRVGKSEGKTYRFFAELEALEQHQQQQQQQQLQHHLSSLPPGPPRQQPIAADAVPVTMLMPPGSTVLSNPHPINMVHINPHHHHQQQNIHINNVPPHQVQSMPVAHSSPIQMGNSADEATASPSLMSPSSSSTSSDEEISGGQRKRKRKWKGFFDKLMKDVTDKQEELQKRFLEVVEKREHDRLARDEAWKMQEMARLNRERELLVQERSMSAAKDAALISFLQKLSDQHQVPFPLPVQIQDQTKTKTQVINSQPISGAPQVVPTAIINQSNSSQQILPPQPSPVVPQPRVEENLVSVAQAVQPLNQFPPQQPPPPPSPTQLAMVVAHGNNIISTISQVHRTNGNGNNHNNNNNNNLMMMGASSSRWPKEEIEALINLRSNLDQKYQENGPKGPLWEEISAGMKKLGYNRNAKRCKEKWENINKYFKKVKESNKKRPEDSKTCPYFHQLDALYREKKLMEITTTNTNTNIATATIATTTTATSNSSYHQVVAMPIAVQQEQQWPVQHDNSDSENTEDDDGEEDDDEEDHGSGYEIVANNAGGSSMGPTTSIATTTA